MNVSDPTTLSVILTRLDREHEYAAGMFAQLREVEQHHYETLVKDLREMQLKVAFAGAGVNQFERALSDSLDRQGERLAAALESVWRRIDQHGTELRIVTEARLVSRVGALETVRDRSDAAHEKAEAAKLTLRQTIVQYRSQIVIAFISATIGGAFSFAAAVVALAARGGP